MTLIDAVFFDCDGVLVNTEPLHYRAFLRTLAPYGISFDYETYVNRYIGFDDRDAFSAIASDYTALFRDSDIQFLIEQKNALLIEEASRGVDTFDGVVPFVKSLFDAGIPLGLVSGSFRREVEVFLNYLGILELFSIFVTAEDVKHSKPDPESYLKALDLMSDYLNKTLNPSSCFAFEDTPAGIEAAKGANIKVIGVEHSFDRKDLYKADVVIPSFKEMSLDSFMSLLKEIG